MINFDTVGIPITFVIIASVLLWFLIGAKGNWYLKAALIVITLYTSVGLWLSIDGMLGWPTYKDPPKTFQIHWLMVEEPNKIAGSPGAVYLWASDIDKEEKSRLYALPYSRNAHEQSEDILDKLKNGKPVVASKSKNGEKGANREDESETGEKSNGGMGQKQDYIFHVLPPVKLLNK